MKLNLSIKIIICGSIAALVFCAGHFSPKNTESKTSLCGSNFSIDSIGLLRFNGVNKKMYLIAPEERFMDCEAENLTYLNVEKQIYVLRMWGPGGNGVSAFYDTCFQVEKQRVYQLFQSGGSVERFLHDNFEPGVKQGDISSVNLPRYFIENDKIIEKNFCDELISHDPSKRIEILPKTCASAGANLSIGHITQISGRGGQ